MTNNAEGQPNLESGSERRRSDRKPLIVEVNFEGGATTDTAQTREVGLGGMYLATRADLPINAQLKLKFKLGEIDLQLNGIVVYRDQGEGVGIRFLNVPDETQAVLKRELPAIETANVSVRSKR